MNRVKIIGMGTQSYYWSTTNADTSIQYARRLDIVDNRLGTANGHKDNAQYSVRLCRSTVSTAADMSETPAVASYALDDDDPIVDPAVEDTIVEPDEEDPIVEPDEEDPIVEPPDQDVE